MLAMIFIVIALICFIVAAANVTAPVPISWGWLGAAFLALMLLIGNIH